MVAGLLKLDLEELFRFTARAGALPNNLGSLFVVEGAEPLGAWLIAIAFLAEHPSNNST